MKEIWKEFKSGHRTYFASNLGRIKRPAGFYKRMHFGNIIEAPLKEKILAGKKLSPKGYPRINLGQRIYFVHRIIGKIWIPNPKNKPQINHKNGIKTDNRIKNLEWVTNQENRNHGIRMGLCLGPNYGKKKRFPLFGGNI